MPARARGCDRIGPIDVAGSANATSTEVTTINSRIHSIAASIYMHVCLLDQTGAALVHRNMESRSDRLPQLIRPDRGGVAVAADCMFAW
jgi:hypothetical protein